MNWVNKKGLPIVSAILVAVNVLVFILCEVTGDGLYRVGRLTVRGVLGNGEYGRLLWAMFLHGDINHIFNNMLLLFLMGDLLEKEIGHIPYMMIYFLAGLGGNVLSLFNKVMTADISGSIGASGAVFGLDGLLLAIVLFAARRPESATPGRVVLMIAYSLYSGFTGQNIDNAAHVGGLVVGFLAGSVVCIVQRRKIKNENVRCDIEY